MRYSSKGWTIEANYVDLTVKVVGELGQLCKKYQNALEVFEHFKACKKYLESL